MKQKQTNKQKTNTIMNTKMSANQIICDHLTNVVNKAIDEKEVVFHSGTFKAIDVDKAVPQPVWDGKGNRRVTVRIDEVDVLDCAWNQSIHELVKHGGEDVQFTFPEKEKPMAKPAEPAPTQVTEPTPTPKKKKTTRKAKKEDTPSDATPKADLSKLNFYKYTCKKKDVRKPMTCVYHDHGYKVATDGRILLAAKMEYPTALEGKMVDCDGIVMSEGRYPNWRYVLPNLSKQKDYQSFPYDATQLKTWLEYKRDQYKQENGKRTRFDSSWRVNFHGTFFDPEYFEKMVMAAKALGAECIWINPKDNLRPGYVETENGYSLIMPMRNDSEPDEADVLDVETWKAPEKVEKSPIMKQYEELKKKHPDAMLLFRCGDFYETYEDDAEKAAKILGITLTKHNKTGVRMAGFPYHALDIYLPKIIRSGQRVAICDQLEDPKTKKLAKRS